MDSQDHERDLLSELQQSTSLFLMLGGHLPKHKQLPLPADYVGKSLDDIKRCMRLFQDTYLFPHLMKIWRDQGINIDIDVFLSHLREQASQKINLDIGRCLQIFRSGFPPQIIFVHARRTTTDYCKLHWVLTLECNDTTISSNHTQAGLEWNRDYHTDTVDITYTVQNHPTQQEMKYWASRVPVKRLEHMCSCALWV
ncbi:hypothetical protein BDV38DRAFT_287744 [Aspergillus pseudotamarii]|uniref:Uncharacterized protein n=1 Tax=Aspergillus pseudotamarii TaxID=132259 RepID=A0A5N6SCI3_ASPPS|nr:uncharacterized protein BDV38DRAFT_287744 [Aspergillus pseudotamarii]KAE8132428.1 hypothetical protein BDV38DRAFT_287744 [Aspergillus pseudotamarii]